MPQGNPFSSSSRYQMGSNATTDQNQGGGSKKAGFPYQIGRESWSSIYLRNTSQNLKVLQFTVNPNVRQSRGIGHGPFPTSYWGMF